MFSSHDHTTFNKLLIAAEKLQKRANRKIHHYEVQQLANDQQTKRSKSSSSSSETQAS